MNALRPSDSKRPSEPEPSLGTLLVQLKDDAVALVESEVELLKAEAADRTRAAKAGFPGAILAFASAVVGLMALTAAGVVALGALLGDRYALSALIFGVALLAIAALSFAGARKHFQRALDTERKQALVADTKREQR